MAGKININPEALKRNLDVIIVVVVAIGLIGYGWLQLGATQTTRTDSATSLETQTRDYNAKFHLTLDGIGLTNSPSITTDESHGNYALAEKAEATYAALLNRVRSKFAPLEIPDGIELDEKTGAIKSVMLMQGGTNYFESDIGQLTVRVISRNGKGAKLKPNLRILGSDSSNYRVENITVEDGGSGYTKGDLAILIEGGGGAGYGQPNAPPPVIEDPDTGVASIDTPGGDPSTGMPVQMGGMPGFGATSMGASTDESEARVGLDNNTFRNFMQSMVFGLQSQCKEQRIRLPKIDDKDKEFRFSFSKVWDQFEFKSFEREIMAYQLAEIDALCRALFNANIHEIYNLKRLKVVRNPADQMEMEDALEYLPDVKFKIEDVKKFTEKVAGSRVMPYEVTFRGFSTELSKVLEELYKSKVFFVVKNIAVIEATGVVDVFEEEQSEMTLGAFGGARSGREMYGMGGRGGMMDPRYQGMLYGGQGFGGFGDERKRHRPASLLLDESPLKVTLKINSLKVVESWKDKSDAISALAQKIETAKKKEEEGGEDDVFVEDTDEDGVDDYDEELVGTDPEDPNDTPTQQQIDDANAAQEQEALMQEGLETP